MTSATDWLLRAEHSGSDIDDWLAQQCVRLEKRIAELEKQLKESREKINLLEFYIPDTR